MGDKRRRPKKGGGWSSDLRLHAANAWVDPSQGTKYHASTKSSGP